MVYQTRSEAATQWPPSGAHRGWFTERWRPPL